MFQSWDSLSSSSRIVGSIFLSSKIIWFWCHRHLSSVLADITPGRRLKTSRIIALVLGLQVIIKLNWKRNLVQQTQYQFSYFIIIKVWRFLQSVIILNSYLISYSLEYYFFSTFIIAKSFLLYILQLYLGAEYLKKNITSLSLLSLLV